MKILLYIICIFIGSILIHSESGITYDIIGAILIIIGQIFFYKLLKKEGDL